MPEPRQFGSWPLGPFTNGAREADRARRMGEYAFVIRAERRRQDLSQSALATRAGVHRSTLNLFENGSRYPSFEVVLRLMQALELPSEPAVLAAYLEDPRLKNLGEAPEE